jgi:SAM-dependent methyltransferase
VSRRAEYDEIGRTYTATRQEDPRLRDAIRDALGDAHAVLNVGAGAGAYEPRDREVIALDPSEVMIAQRPEGAAPVLRGSAEQIPLADDSVDAAMAILTDHHWSDRRAGLREMCRVARRRVVVFNADPALIGLFWLTTEYLPGVGDLIMPAYARAGVWEEELRELLGPPRRSVSSRYLSRTTAATASTARSGGARPRTSTRQSGRGSRSSPASTGTRSSAASRTSGLISRAAPGRSDTNSSSYSTSSISATAS